MILLLIVVPGRAWFRQRVQVEQAPIRSLFLARVLPLFPLWPPRLDRRPNLVPERSLDFPIRSRMVQAPGLVLVEMAVAQMKSMAELRHVWGLVVRVVGEE